jgi:NAD(P)H-hydrate epimerase
MQQVDWRRSGQPLVLTPHPAEMGRLARIATREVQADREGVARRYAAERGVVVVLKGAHTVVAAPDGRLHVDAHPGIVALASGGTGDVLAGLVGALLATGLDPFDAAVAGVTVHAEAGTWVQRERGRAGALASDLLDALPAAQERLRRALEARPAQ